MNMYNPSGNMYGQPVSGNHSDRMEIAAMTLGIISIVSCTCSKKRTARVPPQPGQ